MKKNKTIDNNITHNEEFEFVMERIFTAPRVLVFKAFTEPEHMSKWWAPFGYTIPVCRIDLRQGGLWHYCMRSPDGLDHWVRSIYSEILMPELIVYTSTFADENANPIEGLPMQWVKVTFVEFENKTKLTARFQFASADDLKTTLEMGMAEGFTKALDQLDDHLEEFQQNTITKL